MALPQICTNSIEGHHDVRFAADNPYCSADDTYGSNLVPKQEQPEATQHVFGPDNIAQWILTYCDTGWDQSVFQYMHDNPSSASQHPPIFNDDDLEAPTQQMGEDHGLVFQQDFKSLQPVFQQEPKSRRNGPTFSTQDKSLPSLTSSTATTKAQTITYNEPESPLDEVNFKSPVDELMKITQQRKPEARIEPSQRRTPDLTACADHTGSSAPGTFAAATENQKKWACDDPHCSRMFLYKSHWDAHRRVHTGDKPYLCGQENCSRAFSQRGNLKTHRRCHTGEKPYTCTLEGCSKTFSQLGNMKTHHKNSHKWKIQLLTSLFAKCTVQGEIPAEHQSDFQYFKEHYKNSNKGVKGRGKVHHLAAHKLKNQR